MVLTYYYDLMSQPSRAVYMFLKLNNISFVAKPVAIWKGEHHTDGFSKINPFCLVPVLDDDGFILTESVAILKYLAVKYDVADHWYPRTDLQAQARVDEYMNWQHMNTRYSSLLVFRELIRLPRENKAPIKWDLVENWRSRLEVTVSHLETHFLKDERSFLCGSEISVADLLGICELMQLTTCCEEGIYESKPAVKAWIARVKDKTVPYFEECHQIVHRVRSNFASQQTSKL